MILWTIQTLEAWKILNRDGGLRADPSRVEDYWRPAYQWMAAQMRQRLDCQPSESSLPIWAWFQWHGEHKRRPDLRSSAHLPKGTRGVRIEFEANETQVLLSDFELWHYVLNYWYLPESEAEGEAFEAELAKVGLSYYASKPLPDPKYHERIERSWLRIFDLNWSCDGIASRKEDKSIQAALWELRMENIRKVQVFTAR